MEKKELSRRWYDPRWLEFRNKIFERDAFTCQLCGETSKPLVGHHLSYIKGKEVWEYPEDMVITVCRDCHAEWHKTRPDIIYQSLEQARAVGGDPYRLVIIPANSTDEKTNNDTSQAKAKLKPPRKWKKEVAMRSVNVRVSREDYSKILQIREAVGMYNITWLQPFVKLAVKFKEDLMKLGSVEEIEAYVNAHVV